MVARNGNEVSIRLSDDTMLQARIDGSINLEVGKLMTFEVKSNGHSLLLGPLFTNMAMDANVMKALDMASLPINQTTVNMTQQLMEAGMPIDRNTLQQMYREANMFPQAKVADLVSLHQLGMPVNEDNIAQMASYRNLTYQLVTGLNNVLEALPDVFSHLVQNNDMQGAAELFGKLFELASDTPNVMTGEQTEIGTNQGTNTETDAVTGNITGTADGKETGTGMPNGIESGATDKNLLQTIIKDTVSVFENITESLTDGETKSMDLSCTNALQTPEEITLQIKNLLEHLPQGTRQNVALKNLLKPLLNELERQWTIKPDEVAEKEHVEELYRKLDKQLKGLVRALENAGETESVSF